MFAYKKPLVEVIWHDAEADNPGWENDEDIKLDDCVVVTVGFLVKRSAYYMVIASTLNTNVAESGQSNGRIKIPVGMIKTVTQIGGPKMQSVPVSPPTPGKSK